MLLTAVKDFSACLNGHAYSCKKGELFKGAKFDGKILSKRGLLASAPEKKEAKK